MKLYKFLALAAAAFSVTACSDDSPSFNTEEGVVVEMGQASLITKEGREVVSFPINIKGERNGNIAVTFAIESDYENPATEEENIFFTTKTVVIFPEDNTYDVELGIVDDDVMNETRWCDVKIASVEGGTIGEDNFIQVQIRDNDTEPYDRAAGLWKLSQGVMNDAGDIVYTDAYIRLVGYDEESPAYKNYYQVKGLYQDLVYRAYYHYDDETETGTIELRYGQSGGLVDLGDPYGEVQVTLNQLVADGTSYVADGYVLYHFSGVEQKIVSMEVENMFEPGLAPDVAFMFKANGSIYVLNDFYAGNLSR